MNRQLQSALNNMSAGLCMWSPSGHLILCNERYVQMYNLTPEVTRPGASLRQLLEHRIPDGQFLRRHRPIRRRRAEQHRQGQDNHQRARARRPLHCARQPADAGRRLGRDPRGRHRAAAGRTEPYVDAGGGEPPGRDRGGHRRLPRAGGKRAEKRRRQRQLHADDRGRSVEVVRTDVAPRRRRRAAPPTRPRRTSRSPRPPPPSSRPRSARSASSSCARPTWCAPR